MSLWTRPAYSASESPHFRSLHLDEGLDGGVLWVLLGRGRSSGQGSRENGSEVVVAFVLVQEREKDD